MTTRRHTASLVAALLITLPVSCTATDSGGAWSGALEADQRLELDRIRRSTVHLAFPGEHLAGTAIRLGADRLLTCRHCVAAVLLGRTPRNHPRDADRDDRPVTLADVSGETVMVRLAAAGATDALADDWAVLEIVRSESPGPGPGSTDELLFDGDRPVRPGEEILLVGFPEGTTRWPRRGGTYEPTTVHTTAISPPFFLFVPAEIVCIDAPTDDVIRGMSGGAAVVWDATLRRAVVIGIYRGKRQLEGFGHVWGGVQTVRRVPANVRPR